VQATAGTRVLLIEGIPVLGRIYSCALVAAGCVVEIAGDAELGFERLLAGAYDVVVSDIDVPASAGLDLLKRVRRWRPGVPFVLILAQLDQETFALSREMGMLRCLVKPMSMDQLARAVEGAALVGAARNRSGERRGAGR
jgi:DNA-binding NtrC family response regulator